VGECGVARLLGSARIEADMPDYAHSAAGMLLVVSVDGQPRDRAASSQEAA
jgi:hypothetical protein